jgi:hypothetical protein
MGGGRLVKDGPPPGNGRRTSGSGFVRWIAILFGVSLTTFVVGTVAAALLAPLLATTMLIARTTRLRRRHCR